MDDRTLYKRDKKVKECKESQGSKCVKIRFKNTEFVMKRVIKIGRDEDNDIVIKDDPLVSRRHAIIEQELENYYIYDKDSTNGTYVNNNPIPKNKKVFLNSGDVIRVGNTLLNIL